MTATQVVIGIPIAAIVLLSSAWAQEDEFVIIPKSEVRQIIAELNRLRSELGKLKDRLLGCSA